MMNRKNVSILLTLFILCTSIPLFGQQTYSTGFGLRGGYPSGITGKHFISQTEAIEGIVSFGWGAFGLTGLLQIHTPIADAPGLMLYYGGGAHIAFINSEKRTPWGTDNQKVVLGVDGVVGAEYVISEIPISISLDILPHINFLPEFRPYIHAGLSVRYVMN